MRRLFLGSSVLALGVLGVVQFAGCNGDFEICVGDQCSSLADGGGDSSDGQVVPTGCDLTKDPKDSVACVDESIGLFVAATGSDSNAGTKGSPLKSIGAALAKISAQHSRVYVCEGTYGETVKLTSAVGIYGGFHCADWSYDGNQGKVGPAVPGYALDIENVNGPVAIEDLEFDAKDATNPGDSSIAVFVSTSTASFKRVKVVAGNGADGGDATAQSNYAVDGGSAPSGNSTLTDAGAGNFGALMQDCSGVCTDGVHSTGAAGGGGGVGGGVNGGDGGPALPAHLGDGVGGVYNSAGTSCRSGDTGATAPAAGGGAAGSQKPGSCTQNGWTRLDGTAAMNGGPAQGGGGGSGGAGAINTGGGGGGCGGCGGAGGAGGVSGGSSFSLLSFQSSLTLDACLLTSGAGGSGKSGGAGQSGQSGGIAGSAVPLASGGTGCNGGGGGKGGDGAGGGGGAGGNSIAIGYVGRKPSVTGGSLTEGTAGGAGAGGTGAAGNDGLAGAAGTKADVQELP